MLRDRLKRPLRNLRLSVTDRCNLRCQYCMPEESYRWLPREDILRFGEIARVVDVFGSLGVRKVRLTGGEPLLRRDLPNLIGMLSRKPFLRELAITTNGQLLADVAPDLKRAGLNRITVSLDTLQKDRFLALSKRDGLEQTLSGIRASRACGFEGTKLDTVVMRGTNDDEILELLRFAKEEQVELRFIEYMDVPGATGWDMNHVVPKSELLQRIAEARGGVSPIEAQTEDDQAAPADRFTTADGQVFGIISSTTSPFCGSCDRSRVTADGTWYLCLYAKLGIDLKTALRSSEDDDSLRRQITDAWIGRSDRGAEDRLALEDRGRSHDVDQLRADPRLEMHTRGG